VTFTVMTWFNVTIMSDDHGYAVVVTIQSFFLFHCVSPGTTSVARHAYYSGAQY